MFHRTTGLTADASDPAAMAGIRNELETNITRALAVRNGRITARTAVGSASLPIVVVYFIVSEPVDAANEQATIELDRKLDNLRQTGMHVATLCS